MAKRKKKSKLKQMAEAGNPWAIATLARASALGRAAALHGLKLQRERAEHARQEAAPADDGPAYVRIDGKLFVEVNEPGKHLPVDRAQVREAARARTNEKLIAVVDYEVARRRSRPGVTTGKFYQPSDDESVPWEVEPEPKRELTTKRKPKRAATAIVSRWPSAPTMEELIAAAPKSSGDYTDEQREADRKRWAEDDEADRRSGFIGSK